MTPEERARAGQAVKARMTARGVNLTALARAARVDPKTIRGLVEGRTWPQLETRQRVEAHLGWPLGELVRISLGVRGHVRPLAGYSTQELLAELQMRCAEMERRVNGRGVNNG